MTGQRFFWVTITKPERGFAVIVENGHVAVIDLKMLQFLTGWRWNQAMFHLRRRGGKFIEVPEEEIQRLIQQSTIQQP